MEIRQVDPNNKEFLATGGGAGLTFEHLCEHGTPSLAMHLVSEQTADTEELDVVIATCGAAGLFGAAIGFIQAALGSDAADEFLTDVLAARDNAARLLAERRATFEAADKACCQAGFFTNGREHTCRTATDPQS